MENTALNDTTTKDQDWKTKKGYGPIIVAVSLALLLGVAFCAGQSRGTSLAVGSGTTRGGTTAIASLTMMSNDADSMEPPKSTCKKIKNEADCNERKKCKWRESRGCYQPVQVPM